MNKKIDLVWLARKIKNLLGQYADAAFSIDVRALAFFRIALALIIFNDYIFRALDYGAHYSDVGILPRDAVVSELSKSWQFSLYFLNGTPLFQLILLSISAVFALGLAFGYRTRLMTFLSWVMLVSIHNRNYLVLTSGDVILRLMLFWSMFLPLGGTYSIDSALNDPNPPPPKKILSVATAALLLQPALMYFFVALHKTGTEWLVEKSAVYYALRLEPMSTPVGLLFLKLPFKVLQVISDSTLFYQFAGSLWLFTPFLTCFFRFVIPLGFIGLQIGFGSCLSLGLFPWISAASMIPFFPKEFWDGIDGLFKPRPRIQIFYDQDCTFCRKVTLILRTLLILPRDQLTPAQFLPEVLAVMQKNNSWVVRDHHQVDHFGFDGFVTLVSSSRFFFWLAPLLTTPPIFKPGELIYQWTSTHRSTMSRWSRFLKFSKISFEQGSASKILCFFLLLDILKINLSTIDHRFKINLGLTPIEKLLRIDQEWKMFSPSPARLTGWYVMPGKTR